MCSAFPLSGPSRGAQGAAFTIPCLYKHGIVWSRTADLDLCHTGSPSGAGVWKSPSKSSQAPLQTCISVATLAKDSFNFCLFGGEEMEMRRSPVL